MDMFEEELARYMIIVQNMNEQGFEKNVWMRKSEKERLSILRNEMNGTWTKVREWMRKWLDAWLNEWKMISEKQNKNGVLFVDLTCAMAWLAYQQHAVKSTGEATLCQNIWVNEWEHDWNERNEQWWVHAMNEKKRLSILRNEMKGTWTKVREWMRKW